MRVLDCELHRSAGSIRVGMAASMSGRASQYSQPLKDEELM